MIHVDIGGALRLIDNNDLAQAKERAMASFEQLKDKSGKGAEWLGWRDMLADPNDAILEQIDSLASNIRSDADVFIVCGIGGSYLGARAVIDALSSFFPKQNDVEILYAGHNISGKYLDNLIDYISQPKADGSSKSVYLNVISKSGTTLETALAFRVLRKWMYEQFSEDAADRIFCTTSAEGGALNKLIEEHGYQKFVIPDDVGGRFSVLTPVGLLPIAVAGIDIRTLFYGAVNEYQKLEENPGELIDYAASRFVLYQLGKEIDVICSFEPQLSSLAGWMQQLLGESEGKDGKGIFPTVATYSTDLHSLGQMIQQGERNILETFINVENGKGYITIEEDEGNADGLNYLAGKTYHEINDKAFKGTRQAHIEGGVPAFTVTLDKLNAETIGEFIYFYFLFTGIFVYCLNVNPFNQPGVEAYKKAMYRLLGKEGA